MFITNIKLLNNFKEKVNGVLKLAKATGNEINKSSNNFNDYKTKYIPSLEKSSLSLISTEKLSKEIAVLVKEIEKKITDISKPVTPTKNSIDLIKSELLEISKIVNDNNGKIQNINDKKNGIGEENKAVRRNLCKVVFNDLISVHKTNFETISKLDGEIFKLQTEIKTKKEQQKISKKNKVAATVKSVLNFFFSEKYTLDEDTLR